ncbi:NAD-dependent epimerase/dehydratase family protein [Enterococcus sp. BWM-S5]|uniref:NAD-dependent epimerase/dehydratase family protein n=1 Tax=Enterococcus larvae TaxID=2794352 RepID=A0ABS4CNM5_9ENTE|nr:NAD-dependent epimerase/dehydratase family protein [Enterococcus larvae]MBP1047798.1 NAD-dependent epimerase/dehydratase family protein [Enterococcus larvae]
MKILVTGATGFLGKYVVEELKEAGYEVTAFGRNQLIGEQLAGDAVTFIQGDFTKLSDILTASKGMDAVVHAGALSTVWGKWEDFYQTNVIGTENVLEACETNQIKRLVFISSPSIYAAAKDQLQVKEAEAPKTNELNFYIKSKLLAEQRIHEKKQIDSVILRPRGLFGVGDTSIIPRLIKVNKKIGIPLFDGGQQLVDVTCVENVALAIRLSLESEKAIGETYNITNDEPAPFKDILDQLHQEIGVPVRYLSLSYSLMYGVASTLEKIYTVFRITKEPLFTKYTLYLLKYSQTLSIEKAKNELNYQPKMTITEGIKNYAEHYRNH